MSTPLSFQSGDLVRLKSATSGRPLMIESVVGGGSHVLCRLTNANGDMIKSAEEPRSIPVILLKHA